LAIQNGAVYAWGYNLYGELGNNSTLNSNTPVAVIGLTSEVGAIAAGQTYSLAIQNGKVYAWGHNDNGQLGNGTFTNSSSPVQVTGITNATSIAAGSAHCLAIQNGAVYAWGENYYGETGRSGGTGNQNKPVAVAGLDSGATGIAAGSEHSLALKDGLVYAWGNNQWGELGQGTSDANQNHNTPTLVPGLSSIVQIAACSSASYALASNGTLWTWGDNSSGQLGDGTHALRYSPVQILPPSGYFFTGIAAKPDSVIATVALVPEPSALALLGIGTVTLLVRRRHSSLNHVCASLSRR